ncbi:GIY-YIG nuclease family protein [Stenotrophomonas bentonitica]|uniref:GIY-YIG nuclease family protein n=1 Tax=Stenotrophomonas bentonitica TaxID=1450134 RepID=A0ABU9JNI3_9GAMM
MENKKWNRSQKYHKRTRYLYALFFDNEQAVYIGQSVDLKKRWAQHRSKVGKWNRSFRPVELASYDMTQHEAEAMEELWRCKAVQSGWRVFGLPPGILINPYRRAGLWKRWKARKLVWKTGRPEVAPAKFPWKGLGIGLGVMMGVSAALPWAASLVSG